jgi:cytochrome oxidase Cu insertion factor (SCO1/SenC/PrrC family)
MCSLGGVSRNKGQSVIGCSLFFGLLILLGSLTASGEPAADEKIDQTYPSLPFSSDFGGPFKLMDHTGKQVTEQDFLGSFVILYFGYTNCPDICPTALNTIAQALEALGPEANRITPLFVNLDLERDSLEQLEQYVHFFHPRLIGLLGSERSIAMAAGAYGIRFRYVEAEGGEPLMIHSGKIFFLGPNGKVLAYFPHEASVDWLVTVMRGYLADSRSTTQ